MGIKKKRVESISLYLFLPAILFYFYSIYLHAVHIDEAWMGEQSYFMARDGYPHSNLFYGLNKQQERVVFYHHLPVYAGAAVTKIAGFHLFTLRFCSIILSVILLAIMATKYSISSAILLLLMPLFFKFSKIFRPEAYLAFFGFLSFVFLENAILEKENRFAVISGIMAGLATLSHLNGLIFLFSALFLLSVYKKWTLLLLFFIGFVAGIFPLVVDIAKHYQLFILQFSNGDIINSAGQHALNPFLNLLNEHKRLFRKPEIIFTSLLFISSLLVEIRDRFRKCPHFYIYVLSLIFFLGSISPWKWSIKYAVPLFPFFAIHIAETFTYLKKNYLSYIFTFFLAVFLVSSIVFDIDDAASKENTAQLSGAIENKIGFGSWIIGPVYLVFNEIEHYRITSLYLVDYLNNRNMNAKELYKFAASHNINYIVLDSAWVNIRKLHGINDKIRPVDIPHFELYIKGQ